MPIEEQKARKRQRQQQLIDLSAVIREKILSDILVRRTRTDVKKYYEDDMQAQDLHFPDIAAPKPLIYRMQDKVAKLFADSCQIISQNIEPGTPSDYIRYYRYRAIEFIEDPKVRDLYKGRNLDPERFSRQLAKIMQINLVKRLESSFTAFKASLENLRQYTQNMIDMWENDTIFICPDIDVNYELRPDKRLDVIGRLLTFDECAADIRSKIQKLNDEGRNDKRRNREMRKSEFDVEYIKLLRADLQLITSLYKSWNKITFDPKMEVFKMDLGAVLLNPETNPSGKLVIFTEAVDTQKALVEVVEGLGYKVLEISSKNRKEKELVIRENFDANFKGEWKNDYDIIVTTDVLAEGINLHRANCILNYDTPWNSTKLMQRIGRVNRIGSKAPCVYVYNFMPSAEGDVEIKLVQKAHTKLQSFHTLFGEDSQIFSEEEEITQYDLPALVHGDESPLQRYIHELREFKENYPERYDFISQCDANLQQAIEGADGESYFLVKTPRFFGMFVKVDKDNKAYILSTSDMLESFRVAPTTRAAALPENWPSVCKVAEKKVNQELVRITSTAKNSQNATEAKGIIKELLEQPGITEDSKKVLGAARMMIEKGNPDIIKRIRKLDKLIHPTEQLLFDFTQDDINEIIRYELENILDTARKKHGAAQVYIGLAK